MHRPKFSVVIATYNRVHLVGRAIQSCLDQNYPDVEVIVVDDSSTDTTPEVVPTRYPQVRYLRQPRNQGCSVARNRGIQEATGEWVVVLDDDDTLLPGALSLIADQLAGLQGGYPVLKFATSNGQIPDDFRVLSMEDYLAGVIQGDFTPVIHRERFLAAGLAYPNLWVGAEHLLWWRVAKTWGIPTWGLQTTKVGLDAPTRLTSWGEHRIARASEYAEMQELTLQTFPELNESFPRFAAQKHRAAAIYWLLAGRRTRAVAHLRHLSGAPLSCLLIMGLVLLPTRLVRGLFRLFASRTRSAPTAKRMLMLITGLARGGAEVQVVALAKSLRARGWDVHVVSMLPPQAFVEELNEAGVRVTSLEVRRGAPPLIALLRLARLLRRERPLVLHAHMFHANLMARLVRPLAPVPVLICTAHNTYEVSSRAKRLREITWREMAYRVTDPFCDLTTQISQAGLDRYVRVRAVPASKIRVVHNGIDVQKFRPDLSRRGPTRESLGIGDAFLWLAVGRLEPQKDYANLLDAAAHLQKRAKDNWVICVAGQGPLLGELRSRAERLGVSERVRFLGLWKDIPALMNAADGFVLPSAWEGLPMVLLEAAATGLPIVATDVGGIREVVLDGKTGFLVPPRDPSALAEAMLRLRALPPDERARMGQAGRTHVESNYSLERVVEWWETLYNDLLARNEGRPRRMGVKGR